jgi:hypothetical protein
MDFSPIFYRLKKGLRGGRRFSYSDVCSKEWIVCPAPDPSRKLPGSIALDGQFDRVTGLSHSGKTFERERALLAGEWKESRVTTAYLLKDAALLNGYLYKGPFKQTLVSEKEKLVCLEKMAFIDKAALGCTHTGNTWYSHWMTDNLTLELAAQDLAKPILCQHKPYGHAADYRQYLEMKGEVFPQVRCGELIVIDDVSQNDYKRKRYNLLRDRLKKLGSERSGHGVMILRGSSGQLRLLVNEAEVAQYLADRGFTLVNPQKMSVKEIVRSIQGAKIVVGVEGSTMVHGFFSIANGGTICILQPPFRFNALYKEYTDCVGMRFAYVVGRAVERGFSIDLDELGQTLDLIEKAQEPAWG